MLKRYTDNIDFDLYRNAADKLGITYVPLFEATEPCGYFAIGRKRIYIERNKLGVNNSISNSIARNKYRTFQLLDKLHLPCPRAIQIHSDESITAVSERIAGLRRPLVVKPNKGSLGKGVSVRLNDPGDIAEAVQFARRFNDTIIIEEFMAGTNYRVTVFASEVIDIVERIPAYVVGDGTSAIKELVEQKNRERTQAGLKPIRVDQELRRFVRDQQLDLAGIPERGRRINLRLGCNMSSGGETRRLDLASQVHPDNLRMFVAARRGIGLALAGIDFITPDIAESHKHTRCGINEINRAPMLDAHFFADFAMNNVAGEKILAKAMALSV